MQDKSISFIACVDITDRQDVNVHCSYSQGAQIMNELVIEAVVMAFTLGGIVGAAAALSLKSSRLWRSQESTAMDMKPIPLRHTHRRD
jgi:hypothetical protein